MSDLYSEENEFKELHNSYLKRPAAVTITKPLLSNNEMEDVLTRLLRNYVPPSYIDSYYVPPNSGGLSARAILLCYRTKLKATGKVTSISDEKTVGYAETPVSHAPVEVSQKVVTTKDTTFIDREATPFDIRLVSWDETLLFSSELLREYSDFVSRGKTYSKTKTKKTKNGETYTVEDPLKAQIIEEEVTFDNDFAGLLTSENKKAEKCVNFDDINSPYGIHCVLYLFSKTDHDYFLAGKDGYSQNAIFKMHDHLFKNSRMPQYLGQKILYYPDVNKQGDDPNVTKAHIRKSFGSLPFNEISAYCWHFVLENRNKYAPEGDETLEEQLPFEKTHKSHLTMLEVTEKETKELIEGANDVLALPAFYNKLEHLSRLMYANKAYWLPDRLLAKGEEQPVVSIYKLIHGALSDAVRAVQFYKYQKEGYTGYDAYNSLSGSDVYKNSQISDPARSNPGRLSVGGDILGNISKLLYSLLNRKKVQVMKSRETYVGYAAAGREGALDDSTDFLFITDSKKLAGSRPYRAALQNWNSSDPTTVQNIYESSMSPNDLPMLKSEWSASMMSRIFTDLGKLSERMNPISNIPGMKTVNSWVDGAVSRVTGDNVSQYDTPAGTATTAKSKALGLGKDDESVDIKNLLTKNRASALDVKSQAYNLAVSSMENNGPQKDSDGFIVPQYITAMLDTIESLHLTMSGDIGNSEYFLKKSYTSFCPLLPIDSKTTTRLAEERKSVQHAKREVGYVTSTNPVQMTLLDFKVRYYSVLIELLRKKVDKYKEFLDDGIIHFPLYDNYRTCYNMLHDKTAVTVAAKTNTFSEVKQITLPDDQKVEYCRLAEELFFSIKSGMFITSNTKTKGSVTAPLWNAMPSKATFAEYEDYALKQLGNFDVSNASINKVIHGSSSASLTIKNDKDKYSFDRANVLNRTEVCIEPMDSVVIYLPTLNDNIKPVFTGLVTTVTANNDAGYHSIDLELECNLKNLRITRTNMKPSVNREEAGNNPVTPFSAPISMYASVEKWMPVILTQGLTYFHCMPAQTDANDAKKQLWKFAPIKETQTVKVNKYDSSNTELLRITAESPATEIKKKGFITSDNTKYQEQDVDEYYVQYTDVKVSEGRTTLNLGTYNQVQFSDPLFNYLWYKSCSKFPPIEKSFVEKEELQLYREYVKTSVVYPNGYQEEKSGIEPLHDQLKQGNRCSYLIYKQRYEGSLRSKTNKIKDKVLVASLIGTGQPTFYLNNQKTTYQQSNWKTNLSIIEETADKMNFCFYCDNAGIIRFTPYNFDLTLLNNRLFYGDLDPDGIDSYCMLHTRNAKSLENDENNVLILKKKYLSSYDKSCSDGNIVNWLRLTGDFIVAKSALIQAQVQDPVLIKQYGIHPGSPRNVTGISSEETLQLYGMAWMDRQNKKMRSARISGLYDARMDVNMPYYVPHDEVIYLCESLSIDYTAGTSCTYTMGATYGKKPLFKISEDWVFSKNNHYYLSSSSRSSIQAILENLFTVENKIKPTVFAQYKYIFGAYNYDNVGSAFDTNVLTKSITDSIDKAIDRAIGKITDTVTDKITSTVNLLTNKLNLPDSLNLNQFIDPKLTTPKAETYNNQIMTCAYNGYVWDNVACISFDELIYNYGWLFQGKGISGFKTTLAMVPAAIVEGEEEDKTGLLKTLSDYIKPSNYMGVNFTEEARASMQAYTVDMIAIETNEGIPSIWKPASITFGDLAQSPVVTANSPQTTISKSTGIVARR